MEYKYDFYSTAKLLPQLLTLQLSLRPLSISTGTISSLLRILRWMMSTLTLYLCLISLTVARMSASQLREKRIMSKILSEAAVIYHTGNKEENMWNYDSSSSNGPQHWGEYFPHCNKSVSDPYPIIPHTTRQSPINIDTNEVQQSTDFHIQWRYSSPALEGTITESHKAPTFQVTRNAYNMNIKDTDFILQQFHIHFSDHEMHGSEHAINSQKFDAEVHYVHYKKEYGSFENALEKQDGLLVVSVLLQVGCPVDPLMDSILEVFDPLRFGNDYKAAIESADVLRKEFYIYEGSTTSPSCHEHVLWLVQRQPIAIAQRHMDMLRTLHFKDFHNGERIAKIGNCRPLQSYYTPKVYSNFNPASEGEYQEIKNENCNVQTAID